MLTYKFPTLQEETDAIKRMQPSDVGELENEILSRMKFLQERIRDYWDNLIESYCSICEKFGYGYFDIPDDWGWAKTGHLMCTGCQARWEKRFGEKPELNREGEIVYEYERIPKDSTLGRQTNFEFS